MRSRFRILPGLLVLLIIAGCASTKVTEQTPMTNPGLARPNNIWVYDFVAAPSDMPTNSSMAGEVGAPSTPPTPEELEMGRKFGAMIARAVGQGYSGHGHARDFGRSGIIPQVGDGIIRGYIVSTEGGNTGSMVKRMVIGFGSGTAEMDSVVEGYLVTPNGWKKLGSGTLTSEGNKMPGLVVPAAVAIATANPVGLIVVGGIKITVPRAGERDLKVARNQPLMRSRPN